MSKKCFFQNVLSHLLYFKKICFLQKVVAIKRIVVEESRRSRCTKAVMREANILLSLDHNHIVKCYEWFLDDKVFINLLINLIAFL